MNCGMECIKYLLFFFNFLFALCGLAIIGIGVIVNSDASKLIPNEIDFNISYPATFIIFVGSVIFIITFFGCCGTIRESHCMIVTFGMLLLALLIIQVAVAYFIFAMVNEKENIEQEIDKILEPKIMHYYDKSQADKDAVNTIQSLVGCCGFNSYKDYLVTANYNSTFPYSCCENVQYKPCTRDEVVAKGYHGCKGQVYSFLWVWVNRLGGVALTVAGVELIGIIFSFCLASAIRNYERRGYRV